MEELQPLLGALLPMLLLVLRAVDGLEQNLFQVEVNQSDLYTQLLLIV